MKDLYDVPLFIDNSCLLTSPNEKIIFARRQHWTVIAIPLLSFLLGSILSIGILYLAFVSFFGQVILFFLATSIIFVFLLSVTTNKILHWYSHIYFITTHKVSEVCCTFHGQKTLQEASLENALCSEIESYSEGLIDVLFQTGDIILTIETAESEKDIRLHALASPHRTSELLAKHFKMVPSDSENNHRWYSASEEALRKFLHQQLWNIQGGML